ncbi:MAG: hypothetical protein HY721_31700, partial [Planctomycetes bacterium]|nr:hypothetical protein [Planctomycetota bacterium]
QLRLAREAGSEDPAIDREAGYLHAEAGRWKESLDAFVRYLERTPALDGSGREDAARRAAKDFVKEHVLPHVEG